MTGTSLLTHLALLIWSVLILAGCTGGGSNDDGTPTYPPVQAAGTIGYVTPDHNFALVGPNGEDMRVVTDTNDVNTFAWSPDGSLIALETGTADAQGIRVITDDGSTVFQRTNAARALWSPRGDHLAVTTGDSALVLDANGREVAAIPRAAGPEWSPDGAALAFLRLDASGKGAPLIFDLAGKAESELFPGIEAQEATYPIAWHPSGGVIAFYRALYEPGTGTKTDISGVAIEWSPDGRMLVVSGDPAGTEGTNCLLLDASKAFAPTIGCYIRPSAENIPPWQFLPIWSDWTADGRYFFYLDPQVSRERVRLYDTVAVSQEMYNNIAGERPDISPDGATVVFMFEGKVWVFPLDASTLVVAAEGGFPAWRPVPASG